MTVCIDTGVFLQIFGRKQPFHLILRALLDGRITLAVSTEILLEYQEITTQLSGAERWHDVAALLNLLAELHGNIRHVETKFRFNVISTDRTTINSAIALSPPERILWLRRTITSTCWNPPVTKRSRLSLKNSSVNGYKRDVR